MSEAGDTFVSVKTQIPDLDVSLRSFEDTRVAISGPSAQTNRPDLHTLAGGGNDPPAVPRGTPDAGPPVVLRGNPEAVPPEYPGGIGADVDDTRRAVGALGPEARMMFELFERTYNTRAGENYQPANLQLREVDPNRKGNIVKWQLFGDSQLYQQRPELGGRDLKPVSDDNAGSSKSPGHMYAIGYNKDGLPSDVLEYYRDTTANKIQYYKQYQLDYKVDTDPQSAIKYEISVKELFAPGQTRSFGAHQNVAGIDHTLGGMTRWYEGANSNFLGVEQFSGWQLDKARLRMNFNGGAVETQTIRPDGTYNMESSVGPLKDRTISQLSRNFYFFDLFGPPKQ